MDLLSESLQEFLPQSGPGDVYSWGTGTNFALGTGSTEAQVAPSRVVALPGKRVISLAAAKFHSAAVTEDGTLFTWGFGRGGRLGHPGVQFHSGESAVIVPRAVAGLGKRQVTAVAAAKHHTLVCTSAGEVWAMGSNRYGQLGVSTADTQAEPRRVSSLRCRVVAVAAANKHSVAVTSAGEIYTWGSNSLGQLGYGTFDSGSSVAPRLVEALKGRVVTAAAAAKRHTIVLTADDEVFTFGHRGVSPRRVQFTGVRDAVAVAVHTTTTTSAGFFDAEESVRSPLRFHRGHADVVRPEAVAICAGAAHSSALTSTGVVLSWRSADPALVVREVGGALAGKRVVSLSAGKYRTAVVTEEGDVYAWEGRSDFFPAGEGRRSGSGSKKQTPSSSLLSSGGGGGGRSGLSLPPKGGRPIPPSGERASSPAAAAHVAAASTSISGININSSLSGGSYGAAEAVVSGRSPSGDSWGSSSHGKYGSFLERVNAEKKSGGGGGEKSSCYGASPSRLTGGGGGGGLSTRADTPRSAARAAMAAVDAFEPILPEKVLALKRAGVVAVGEKHSLALQRWSAVQLEGLPVLPWLKNGAATASASSQWEEEDDDEEDGSCTSSANASPQK